MKETNQLNEMHWHVFPEIAGAGHFFDLASHQFDYFDFVFGTVTNVKGQCIQSCRTYILQKIQFREHGNMNQALLELEVGVLWWINFGRR